MASHPTAAAALYVVPKPFTGPTGPSGPTGPRPAKHGPTGPRTPEGKARVAQNGLKHGLNSRAAVIPGEDREAFLLYRGRMFAEWLPKGADEENLVEKMVASTWRTQRLWEFEGAVYRGERQAANAGPPRPLDTFAHDGEDTATTLERIDHKESTLDRRYDRHLRRLLLLQDQRRKGLRPALALLAKLLAEATRGSSDASATVSGEQPAGGDVDRAGGDYGVSRGDRTDGWARSSVPLQHTPGQIDSRSHDMPAADQSDGSTPARDLIPNAVATPAIVVAHCHAPMPVDAPQSCDPPPPTAPWATPEPIAETGAAIAALTDSSDGTSPESVKQTPPADPVARVTVPVPSRRHVQPPLSRQGMTLPPVPARTRSMGAHLSMSAVGHGEVGPQC